MKHEQDRRAGGVMGPVIACVFLVFAAGQVSVGLTGQFAPSTDAERALDQMLHGKDLDIDLGLANWLVVADIPQFKDLTCEGYLKQLAEMTEQVRQNMAKMASVARSRGQNPENPATRCAMFCHAMIKLRLAYAEEFRVEKLTSAQMDGLYRDPNNIFLAGLLRTGRGSCVSLPLIYLVLGQRLGMPVYLVTVGRHCFIRWDEPGYRMNIETTSVDKVRVTPEDSVYLDGEGLAVSEVTGNQLRNLTRREVVGNLLFARSAHWATAGARYEAQRRLDLARARELAPDDPDIKATQEGLARGRGTQLEGASLEVKNKPKE